MNYLTCYRKRLNKAQLLIKNNTNSSNSNSNSIKRKNTRNRRKEINRNRKMQMIRYYRNLGRDTAVRSGKISRK